MYLQENCDISRECPFYITAEQTTKDSTVQSHIQLPAILQVRSTACCDWVLGSGSHKVTVGGSEFLPGSSWGKSTPRIVLVAHRIPLLVVGTLRYHLHFLAQHMLSFLRLVHTASLWCPLTCRQLWYLRSSPVLNL